MCTTTFFFFIFCISKHELKISIHDFTIEEFPFLDIIQSIRSAAILRHQNGVGGHGEGNTFREGGARELMHNSVSKLKVLCSRIPYRVELSDISCIYVHKCSCTYIFISVLSFAQFPNIS